MGEFGFPFFVGENWGLRIRKHDKLASFAAIKAAVLTCPEDKWQVEDNLYNPTYKQLVEEGQWTKPNIQE